jgi:hypothetical protein
MQKSEDASSPKMGVVREAPKPPPKQDFQFPKAKDGKDPRVEWAIRVASDAQEPSNIFAAAGGEDVALCWHDRRQKKRYEVFFARFGLRSQKRGPAVSVVPKPGPALNPSLAWDGVG